jgi:hypothetical protein
VLVQDGQQQLEALEVAADGHQAARLRGSLHGVICFC